jgi:hypothetical protein
MHHFCAVVSMINISGCVKRRLIYEKVSKHSGVAVEPTAFFD